MSRLFFQGSSPAKPAWITKAQLDVAESKHDKIHNFRIKFATNYMENKIFMLHINSQLAYFR